MKQLFYFTRSFPYGLGERWKYNDLDVLRHRFDRVTVVPLMYGGTSSPVSELPVGVELEQPIYDEDDHQALRPFTHLRSSLRYGHILLLELIRSFARPSRLQIKRILLSYFRGVKVVNRISGRRLFAGCDPKETTSFFFWGVGAADAVPWLSGNCGRIVVGFHGFDLYEERHKGLAFPFRERLLSRIDHAAPCSLHGARHLQKQFPEFAHLVHARTLGVEDAGVSHWEPSTTLRLVSCAFVSRVKRVELMVDLIKHLPGAVSWTHIGGGDGLQDLIRYAEQELGKRDGMELHFTGAIPPGQVREVLSRRSFDFFINTSMSEALPVSIMEALSAGISVLATDVGGVSQLVDSEVGALLPSDPSAELIASELVRLSSMSVEERIKQRASARQRFEDALRVPDVIEEFADRAFGKS